MSKIEIQNKDITRLDCDAIVNAANSGLKAGGGVCGSIFNAAGYSELTSACNRIGHCNTGDAAITDAFNLRNNKYIIHAVGPVYKDGQHGEDKLLYSCYKRALELAKDNGCKSIAFPLISSGRFGYPLNEAWEIALSSCIDAISSDPGYDISIVFVGNDPNKLNVGKTILNKLYQEKVFSVSDPILFWKLEDDNGYLSNWYPSDFVLDGVKYWCVEQYLIAKKALLFGDYAIYDQVMHSHQQMNIMKLH